jgi:hypothetical protein
MRTEENFDLPSEDDDRAIGKAFVGSLLVFALLGLVGYSVYWFVSHRPAKPMAEPDPVALPEKRELPKVHAPQVVWTDITDSAGIDFVHFSGAEGGKLLPETMGGGCAFFDYDNDGDQDLLLVNACPWPESQKTADPRPHQALYQNDGHGKFQNVTRQAGLDIELYGMGAACADYDGDGWVDVFISCLGRDRLFRNDHGQFVDVTQQAGVGGEEKAWSVSSGWFDYDRDGDLDLMVTHYVEWSRDNDIAQNFRLLGGKERAYGRPQNFAGTYPSLFRNDGQGKFTDVSESSGVQIKNAATGVPVGKSLGLAFEDLDGDGYLDCVIANDTVQNFLLHNQQDGTFQEMGVLAGVAFDPSGAARGAMGIDIAQFRNDASLGIAIGNFANEMTALYVARGRDMQFYDAAVANGLGPATRLQLTFAVLFLDFDLDGRLDVFQANGHLEEDIARVQASQKYEQSPQLFWNAGSQFATEFLPCLESETGPEFQKPMVGRGAAYADIDADGDLDIVIMGCGQKARLLRNDQKLGNHWLRIKLVGKGSNQDAIGTRVILRAGDITQSRLVSPTRSYLSQVELIATFGLGSQDTVDSVKVVWPDGSQQEIKRPEIDRVLVVKQD